MSCVMIEYTAKLVDRLNWTLFAGGMTATTQTVIERAVNAFQVKETDNRLQAALNLAVIAPEFVIQR